MLVAVSSLVFSACSSGTTPSLPTLSGTPARSISVALQVVGCSLNDACAAVGASVAGVGPSAVGEYRSANGHWTALPTPSLAAGQFSAASCWTSGCLFTGAQTTGDLVWRFDAATHTLGAVTPPPGGSDVVNVDCFVPDSCALIDVTPTGVSRLTTTTDAGQSWSTPSTLTGLGTASVRAIACQTTLTCALAASSSAGVLIDTTDDGGSSWTARTVPPSWTGITSLACHGRACTAVVTTANGARLARSTDFTRSWRTVALDATPTALACTTGTSCVLVGADRKGGPWLATSVRRTLTPRTLRYVPAPLIDVACGSTRCAAIEATTLLAFAT